MKSTLAALCLSVALSNAVLAATPEPAPDYAALKARLQGGDPKVDYLALRMAHAESGDYRPNSPDSLVRRKAVQDAIEARRFDEAAALLEKWLAADFLNPFAHLGAIRAYRELGKDELSAFHNAVVDGLFASICGPDEGQSENRPCRVLSIDEQHFFLVMNGFMVNGEYGTTCSEARPCQVYEVTKQNTNEAFTLYFDISRPLAFQEARRKVATDAAAAQKP